MFKVKSAFIERCRIDHNCAAESHTLKGNAVSKGVFVYIFEIYGENYTLEIHTSVERAVAYFAKLCGESGGLKIFAALKHTGAHKEQAVGKNYVSDSRAIRKCLVFNRFKTLGKGNTRESLTTHKCALLDKYHAGSDNTFKIGAPGKRISSDGIDCGGEVYGLNSIASEKRLFGYAYDYSAVGKLVRYYDICVRAKADAVYKHGGLTVFDVLKSY